MRVKSWTLVSIVVLGACSSQGADVIGGPTGTDDGGGTPGADASSGAEAAPPDDAGTSTDSPAASDDDAPSEATTSGGGGLGTVTNASDVACPSGLPPGTTCKTITVAGCPGIETETIDALIGVLAPTGAVTGTVTHFKGGGGEGVENSGTMEYAAAGLRQVYVSWMTDWEQTAKSGIKAAGCRPSTVLKWVFDTIHGGSRTAAFCGQGFSGGSGQLGYALAHYGMADYLDYVNELSGPPFARIDLGCNGDAPATATVCGATDTMRLPSSLDKWENIPAPLRCGSTGVPAAELDRWKNDSIAVGGVYAYPKTEVQFFDCTNQATAVTAMAQIYMNLIAQAEGDAGLVGYHCFSAADGCQGEGLGSGNGQAVSALLAGCKPRH